MANDIAEKSKRIDDFLAEAGYFTLSTVDGDSPRARPLGMHFVTPRGVCFGVGDFKDVYKQMQANPEVEITACAGGRWLRFHGRAVFLHDEAMAARALEAAPQLKSIYNEETGHKLELFVLEDAKAEFIDMMTVSETLTF